MRTQKVLPPDEPMLENGTVPVRSTWWRFFRNMFGDVQDSQSLAIEGLLPRGPDNPHQIGDLQSLSSQRGVSQTGELERRLVDLQTLSSLRGQVRELERKFADLQEFVFATMQPHSTLVQTTGPWTPADNSGASLTFTGVSASYTQIGNMVFAYFTLTYPATADGTAASIKGLPYLVPNVNYAQAPCVVETSATIANEVVLVPAKNTFTAAFDTGNPLTAVLNSTLSGATVSAKLIYPIG